MVHSIELVFDGVTEAAIRRIWADLAAAGIPALVAILLAIVVQGILAGLLAEGERSAGQPEAAAVPRGRVRRPDGLTFREAEVLNLLTFGHTNVEIAAELVVSVHTVERHLANSYRKIGVRNRADASAYMARGGR